MPAGTIPWLKAVEETAVLPKTADREGAALVLERMLRRPVSPETVRRWPIPYLVVAGVCQYSIADLVEYARKRFDEAPRRVGGRSNVAISSRLDLVRGDDRGP